MVARPAARSRHPRRARPRRDGRDPARAVRRPNATGATPTPTRPLPIDAGQTISQPYMVARMTELLGPAAGRPDPRARDRLRLPVGRPAPARCDGHHHRAPRRPRRHGPRPPGRARLRAGSGRGPDGRRQPRRPGRRALGRDHRHRGGAGRPDRASRTAGRRRPARDPGRPARSPDPDPRRPRTATTGAIRPHGACVFVPLIGPGGFPDDDR